MKKILALLIAAMMVFALAACGSSSAETTEAPAAAAPAVEEAAAPEAPADQPAEAPAEGDASGEMGEASGEMGEASGEMGEASGEMSGEPTGELASSGDFEITVDGVTGTAHYEDTSDAGDQVVKTFAIEWQGQTITGGIDTGVWTADNAADQAVVDAVHEAFEANNTVGPQQ